MLITLQLPNELAIAYNNAMQWSAPEVQTRLLKENYWPQRNTWIRGQMDALFGADGWFDAQVVYTTKPVWNGKFASDIFVTVAYRVEQDLQYFEDVH